MTVKRALQLTAVNELDSERRLHILDIIDKLRELGISESVSLPQARACSPSFI